VEFVLNSDHEALRFLEAQKKLNSRHSGWVSNMEKFSFVLNHKAGSSNKVADALSFEIVGFDLLPEYYAADFLSFQRFCKS